MNKKSKRSINVAKGLPVLAIVAWVWAAPAFANRELTMMELTSRLVPFRIEATTNPQAAFTQYAEAAAVVRLGDLGGVLCPITEADRGWQFFFGTSIAAVTSLTDKIVLTMFYNPWADVALLCEWTNLDGTPRISDAELVMGDILRKTKKPVLTPLWRREGEVPPQLAVTVAASDTVRAFLDIYGKPPLLGAANWRGKLPNLKSKQQLDGNRMAVGALFSLALASVNTFFNEAPFAPLKASMDEVRQLLIAGRTEEVLARAPETSMESRTILTEVPLAWQQATLVSLATDAKHAFVFLASYDDPEMFACFWFRLDDVTGAATLLRIDFLGFNLSFQDVDRIARQAGMKR